MSEEDEVKDKMSMSILLRVVGCSLHAKSSFESCLLVTRSSH